MTHTPGPWHMGQGNGAGSIFGSVGRMRLTDHGTTLWPICRMVTGWKVEDDEDNARLIAAAPELLEAAEAVMEFYQNGTPLHSGSLIISDLRKAIARAKGVTDEVAD